MPQDLIVGLDIGTTKICAVVGEVREHQLDIVGLGSAPTGGGLRKGVVVNIENTVRAIRRAVEEAETMAGCEIRSVYAGVGGGQTKVINSQGIIAIKDREVTPADMDRVIETARTVAIPSDREVIHTLVQEFPDRRPGRHQRPGGHPRGAPGVQGPHRHRGRDLPQ